MENEIRIRTADGEMPTFVAHPDSGGPFPVALLYMDGVGYREQIKENARRFAAACYYCVAPDLYHRAGEGIHFDLSNLEAARERVLDVASSVKPEKVVADLPMYDRDAAERHFERTLDLRRRNLPVGAATS